MAGVETASHLKSSTYEWASLDSEIVHILRCKECATQVLQLADSDEIHDENKTEEID